MEILTETRTNAIISNKVKKQVYGYRMSMWRKHNLIRVFSELLRVILMHQYICGSMFETLELHKMFTFNLQLCNISHFYLIYDLSSDIEFFRIEFYRIYRICRTCRKLFLVVLKITTK